MDKSIAAALCTIVENIGKLIDVKTIVTLGFSYGMLMLLSGKWAPTVEVIALFSTSFGAVITYFFTKAAKPSGADINGETK